MVKFTEKEIEVLQKSPEVVQLLIDYHDNDSAAADACECIEVMYYHDNRIKELKIAKEELCSNRR